MFERRPVLIVDDDREMACLLQLVLERAGYHCLYAENGREALALLGSGVRPGVILLDVHMPEMDGIMFQAERLKDRRLARIPVVIVTADMRAADRMPIPEVWGYIVKPPDQESLLAAVARFYAPQPSALAS